MRLLQAPSADAALPRSPPIRVRELYAPPVPQGDLAFREPGPEPRGKADSVPLATCRNSTIAPRLRSEGRESGSRKGINQDASANTGACRRAGGADADRAVLDHSSARFGAIAKLADKSALAAKQGARGADLEGAIPDKANWPAHNHTHLHEQPTPFYATVLILAVMGPAALDVTLAWVYVGLRIVHSAVAEPRQRRAGAVLHCFSPAPLR